MYLNRKHLVKKSLPLLILCYLTIYIVWGSTYYFIKLGVETIAPFLVVGIRFFIGGLGFLVFCVVSQKISRMPTGKELLSAIFMGTFLLLGGNALVTIAEKKIDSYLAALIITSTPLLVALWNLILFRIRLKLTAAIGIVLGIFGVAVILYNGHSIQTSLSLDVVLILGAAIMWSFATAMGHSMPRYPDVFVNSGLQMLYVGIVALCIQGVLAPHEFVLLAQASVPSMVGVGILASVGSLAFAAFHYLLIHQPAQRVSSYSLVNPAIAVLLGVLIAGEKPTPLLLFGLPFSLVGIGLLLYGEKLFKKKSS